MALQLLFKKDVNVEILVDEQEAEKRITEMSAKPTTTTTTPATSTTSSPSLPSSTTPSPLQSDSFVFESLEKYSDENNLNDRIPTIIAIESTSANEMMDQPGDNEINNDARNVKLQWTRAPPSKKSLRTRNPIRAIVDPIMSSSANKGQSEKEQISLAVSVSVPWLKIL